MFQIILIHFNHVHQLIFFLKTIVIFPVILLYQSLFGFSIITADCKFKLFAKS